MNESFRQILTWIIISQGIVLSSLLLYKRINRQTNVFLALYLLVLLLIISVKTFQGVALYSFLPYTFKLPYTLWFITGPLQLGYIRSMVGTRKLRHWHLLHLLPWVCVMAILWPQISMEPDAKILHWQIHGLSVNPQFDLFFALAVIISNFGYAAYSFTLLKTDVELPADQSTLKWLKYLTVFLMTVFGVAFGAEFLMFYELESLSPLYDLSFYGIVLLFYSISFRATLQPQIFGEEPGSVLTSPSLNTKSAPEYSKNKLATTQANEISQRLVDVMEREKLYLDPDLSLDRLAEHLSIPKHHLSQTLSTQLKRNFYQFVNYYRVSHVIQVVGSNQEGRSLLEHALNAGFNSKSSFNRAFKAHTGTTPTAYFK